MTSQIYEYCASGNLEQLQLQIKEKDYDFVDNRMFTLLHIAALNGHTDICKFLVLRIRVDVKAEESGCTRM